MSVIESTAGGGGLWIGDVEKIDVRDGSTVG
jgi:hypothetical protein